MAYVIKLKRANRTLALKHISRNVQLKHVGRRGPQGEQGIQGIQGEAGQDGVGAGVPTGGNTGQILTKNSNADLDTSWQDPTGAVDTVNGQTGAVSLDVEDLSNYAEGTTPADNDMLWRGGGGGTQWESTSFSAVRGAMLAGTTSDDIPEGATNLYVSSADKTNWNAKPDDVNVVHIAGNETVSDTKTFTAGIQVGSGVKGIDDNGSGTRVFSDGQLAIEAASLVDVTVNGTLVARASDTALSLQSKPITDVADPTNAQDAATKAYVDNSISTIIDYNLIDNLPSIKYIAHRGGSSVMPEETMGAFRMARSVGAHIIECDVWTLADGSLGMMHDSTVTRTTDGTGNIADYDAVNVKSLDASDVWPNGYENETVPLFTDVLDEFGGKIIICPEPKDSTSLQKMIDLVVARKLQRSVIFQAVSDAQITTIVSAGCVCVRVYTSEPTTPNIATAVSNGATYLCGNGVTFSQAKLQEMVAALPTWCYTINKRKLRDTLLTYGITGFMSDNPAYLARSTAIKKVDSWRNNVLGHGLAAYGAYSTPQEIMQTAGFELVKNGWIRVQTAASANEYYLVGEVSPLANAAGTYTIDYDMKVTSGTIGTAGMALAIAMDDGDYYMGSTFYPTGWLIYMRESGIYTTFKTTAPSTTTASGGFTVSGAAYALNQIMHMKVEVTPTTIKTTATNMTTGGTGTVTITDSSNRGGYIYIGKTGTGNTLEFANLTITP